MAIYHPDYRYAEGKKLLEELTGENGELIKYYASKREEAIEELEKEIKEMRAVFDGIAKYTYRDPNPILG